MATGRANFHPTKSINRNQDISVISYITKLLKDNFLSPLLMGLLMGSIGMLTKRRWDVGWDDIVVNKRSRLIGR